MPRYFFHFYADGRLVSRDAELPDLACALEECAHIVRERSRFPAERAGHSDSPMLRMADEFGKTIISVPIASLPSGLDEGED